jgi:hypothetical protein
VLSASVSHFDPQRTFADKNLEVTCLAIGNETRIGGGRLSVFCSVFATNLVDLFAGQSLWRHARRIAGFAKKGIQARRRHDPEQH